MSDLETVTGRGQGSTVDADRPSAQLPAENGPRFALPGWSYPESYAGTLKGSGDSDILPGGTYFQAGAGVHNVPSARILHLLARRSAAMQGEFGRASRPPFRLTLHILGVAVASER